MKSKKQIYELFEKEISLKEMVKAIELSGKIALKRIRRENEFNRF